MTTEKPCGPPPNYRFQFETKFYEGGECYDSASINFDFAAQNDAEARKRAVKKFREMQQSEITDKRHSCDVEYMRCSPNFLATLVIGDEGRKTLGRIVRTAWR